MKTYNKPTVQLVKLRPGQPLLSLSGTHDEVGNGVQCGDARAGWEEPDWHEETE